MTPEEIRKLAKSLCATSNPTQDDVWLIEDIIEGILRTHCIVSKEKVRNRYNMAKSNIKPQYPEACQYEVGATQVIESLFGAETFKNSEV